MAIPKRRKLEREMRKLEFILDSGERGNHLLFTPHMIHECYNNGEAQLNNLLEDNFDRIHEIINDTLFLQSFEEKRDYIRTLPNHLRHALIYGYFELIGGNLLESGTKIH